MDQLDLHLGRPVHRGALSLFPVWNGGAVATRGYDLRTSSLVVDERAGSPVVGELVVTNQGPRPVLLLEGELLEGGQQHRVVARTVVVPAGVTLVVEVHCVEQGRWSGGSYRHARRGHRAPFRVRARSAEGQSQVWDEIRRYEGRHGAGPTQSLLDATRTVDDQARSLVAGLRPLPFQAGMLIAISGHPVLLEVFDSPRSLAHAWGPLLRAAAVDAVGLPPVPTPGRRARRFLDRALRTAVEQQRDAGEAVETRSASPYARMTTTDWNGRAVHAVALNPRHELVSA